MARLSIKFKYDKRRGEVTELIVDDHDRTAPEDYHDAIARQIADELVPTAVIREHAAPVTVDPEPLRVPVDERERRRRNEGGS